uniref:Uncharacterized protein n=1 Tax=Rhizophora mucronata TaxID=61149 RepID=A0A2P2M7K3_RHIMU
MIVAAIIMKILISNLRGLPYPVELWEQLVERAVQIKMGALPMLMLNFYLILVMSFLLLQHRLLGFICSKMLYQVNTSFVLLILTWKLKLEVRQR